MRSLWLLAVLCTTFRIVHGTDLIENGGFELPIIRAYYTYSEVGYPPFFPGIPSTAGPGYIPGWTVTTGNVDLSTSGASAGGTVAYAGNQYVDLNGIAPGTLAQNIHTVPGSKYVVTFYLSANANLYPFYGCDSPSRVLTVELVDTSQGNLIIDSRNGNNGYSIPSTQTAYIQKNFTFSAQSESTNIRFISATSGNCGPVIDDVSIWGQAGATPMPAPTSPSPVTTSDPSSSKRSPNVTTILVSVGGSLFSLLLACLLYFWVFWSFRRKKARIVELCVERLRGIVAIVQQEGITKNTTAVWEKIIWCYLSLYDNWLGLGPKKDAFLIAPSNGIWAPKFHDKQIVTICYGMELILKKSYEQNALLQQAINKALIKKLADSLREIVNSLESAEIDAMRPTDDTLGL